MKVPKLYVASGQKHSLVFTFGLFSLSLFFLQEVLKQLQSKLEQEAGTLASSGRSDVLHQLKGPNPPQGACLWDPHDHAVSTVPVRHECLFTQD